MYGCKFSVCSGCTTGGPGHTDNHSKNENNPSPSFPTASCCVSQAASMVVTDRRTTTSRQRGGASILHVGDCRSSSSAPSVCPFALPSPLPPRPAIDQSTGDTRRPSMHGHEKEMTMFYGCCCNKKFRQQFFLIYLVSLVTVFLIGLKTTVLLRKDLLC